VANPVVAKNTENSKNPWQKVVESVAKNVFPENVKKNH